MKRGMLSVGLAAVFVVFAAATVVSALDASPYLTGVFEPDGKTCFRIINPTTKTLDVFGLIMAPNALGQCVSTYLVPNGGVTLCLPAAAFTPGTYTTVKAFAFPQGSRKFDPNAVITGFQLNYWDWKDGITWKGESRTNLTAVTINSNTIGEFGMIPAPCTFVPADAQSLPDAG